MSQVQTTYPNFHDGLVDGQIADTTTCDVDSLAAEGPIAFGRAVRQGAAARGGLQGITDRLSFRGIAVMDERVPARGGASYPAAEIASVLWRGDIAVKVSAAVAVGNDVVVATVASGAGNAAEEVGQLSSKGADATHIAIHGARFITAAAAQGIAIVRLAGPEDTRP